MRALKRAAPFLLAAVLLAGCTQTGARVVEVNRGTPPRATVAGVPLIRQDDFHCGPASLAMVMQWSGLKATQAEIAAQSFSPGARGTYLADMTGAARRRGRLAVGLSEFSGLLDEIAAGHPVIVFQNLGLNWAPKWHYAVAVGYDLDAGEVILHSGELDRMVMPTGLFLRTWRRGENWGLVVLPPDRLPAGGDQWEILKAAAALERTGQHRAAEMVYATGAARWSQSWLWPFGQGNARYQQGDLAGARRALQRAAAIDPSIPEIRHNLAQVKAELAKRSQ